MESGAYSSHSQSRLRLNNGNKESLSPRVYCPRWLAIYKQTVCVSTDRIAVTVFDEYNWTFSPG